MTLAVGGKILHCRWDEFRLERFLPGLIAAVLVDITDIILTFSMGNLTFLIEVMSGY